MLDTTGLNLTAAADVLDVRGEQSASRRFDPISGVWTIFAPSREQRPDQYQVTRRHTEDSSIGCPFCRGAENTTPEPVWIGKQASDSINANGFQPISAVDGLSISRMLATDDPDVIEDAGSDDWLVRVFPNKYPAISQLSHSPHSTHGRKSQQLFVEKNVCGGHEVIVESPDHVESLTDIDAANFALVLAAYRDRLRYWRSATGIKYISLFKNAGGNAGASLAHCHSQLIATDMMPNSVRASITRMQQYRAQTGCCLQCDLVRAELKDKSRVIAKTDDLVAFCPFASQHAMTVRITTTNHQDQFEQLCDSTIESVAFLLRRVTSWLRQIRPNAAYNYLLRTCPPGADDCSDAYHWSIDIFPRLSQIAGFEFSSDCMINSVMPEVAAKEFRQCAAAEDPRGLG